MGAPGAGKGGGNCALYCALYTVCHRRLGICRGREDVYLFAAGGYPPNVSAVSSCMRRTWLSVCIICGDPLPWKLIYIHSSHDRQKGHERQAENRLTVTGNPSASRTDVSFLIPSIAIFNLSATSHSYGYSSCPPCQEFISYLSVR